MVEQPTFSAELNAFIGPDRREYYRTQWTFFLNTPESQRGWNSSLAPSFWSDFRRKYMLSWNWAAFFVFEYWLLYRKMFRYFFIYLATLYLVTLFLLEMELYAFYLGIRVLCGAFANALYYKHAQTIIAKVLQLGIPDDEKRYGEIARRGGTIISTLRQGQ